MLPMDKTYSSTSKKFLLLYSSWQACSKLFTFWKQSYDRNQIKFCKTLKNKDKRKKGLTERFDVAMKSLSSDKDKN